MRPRIEWAVIVILTWLAVEALSWLALGRPVSWHELPPIVMTCFLAVWLLPNTRKASKEGGK